MGQLKFTIFQGDKHVVLENQFTVPNMHLIAQINPGKTIKSLLFVELVITKSPHHVYFRKQSSKKMRGRAAFAK